MIAQMIAKYISQRVKIVRSTRKRSICYGLYLLLLLSIIFTATSCSHYATKPTLKIYTWVDYIHPEVIDSFKKKYRCHVSMSYFDNNEALYSKLKTGGGSYDLVTPSSYMAEIMAGQDMLLALETSLIPNIKELDPLYRSHESSLLATYGVPFTVSHAGIGYIRSQIDPPESWRIFGLDLYKKRTSLLNDFREVIGAALITLGYSVNTTDPSQLSQAKELLLDWSQQIAKFESDMTKTALSSGEFLASHIYSGDALQVIQDRSDVGYLVPQEGFILSMEHLVIPKAAKERALAHAFIQHLLETENAFKNMQFNHYLCPITSTYPLIDKANARGEKLLIQLTPQELKRAQSIQDIGEATRLYTQIWDEIHSQ